jgi:hypothetical protein
MSVLLDRFTFLITHHWVRYWTYSAVVTLVLVDCVQLLFFCVFFIGVGLCASSSSLFPVSALCFRWLFTSFFNRFSRGGGLLVCA